MSIFDIFRKKNEIDLEAQRREHLLRNGRITEGRITDSETTENGEVVYYFYSVHGVDFESSELLTDEQLSEPLKYAPGAKIGVRYDQKQHGNSMLV